MASFASRVPFSISSSSNSNGNKRTSWGDPRDANGRDPPAHANDRPLAHIKDIIASAQPAFDPSVPPTEYLRQAEICLQTSKASLSLGKVDRAFSEYLKASEIAINIIPRHKDYGFFEDNNQSFAQKNRTVRNVVTSMGTQMEGVRKIIEDNNQRHNTQQRSTTSGYNAIQLPSTDPAAQQPRPESQSSVNSTGAPDIPDILKVHKPRPPSVSKPEYLRSSSPVVQSDDLSSRFARLRTNGNAGVPAPGSLQMPDVRNFQTNGANGIQRPTGPRDMPSAVPALPAKLPLAATSMPKPPDPTFSMQSARHEVHRPPTERKHTYYGQPIANLSNPQLQRPRDDMNPYRPRTPNGGGAGV